jgi:hypothetical protein
MSASNTTGRPRGPSSVRASAARLAREVLDAMAQIARDPAIPRDARVEAARLIVDTALTGAPPGNPS